MPKLTDTQLIILSTAAKRESLAVLPLPKSIKLNKGAMASTLKGLLKKGLVEERAASRGEPAWREDEDGGRFALIAARAGLEALGIEGDGADTDERKPARKSASAACKRKTKAAAKTTSPKAPATPRKSDLVLGLLKRPKGASIEELQACTGWQPHSIRAVLTGLRKQGFDVALTKHEGKPSTYSVSNKS